MSHRGVRSYIRLAVDLTWVVLTAFVALLIRDNFIPYAPRLEAIVPYALVSVIVGAIVFLVARLQPYVVALHISCGRPSHHGRGHGRFASGAFCKLPF